MRLADKVALITGSASGMGKLAAEVFAREGASIVVTDILEKEGEETAQAVRDAGGSAIFVKGNVAHDADVQRVVATAIETYGRIDVLYNNAGIM
ncbi:MAG TPA: SDR family NAD(P)-dependent oxidoreductase, partial [Ktedonobacteraceae bacterium]|nr:SDR family NAD(P)-dependent oxidoreductase [Ktedonobacteraceae bacterium]